MKNNRASIYSFLLLFWVLIMISIIIGIFRTQSQEVNFSVVSPMEVLKVRDSLEIFENKEFVFIEDSLKKSSGEFGSDEFHNSFRDVFISNLLNDRNAKSFLFDNLTILGNVVRDEDKNRNVFENGIYPKSFSDMNEDEFIFVRNEIGKEYILETKGRDSISFPVRFNFEFSRKYLIKKVDNEFIVRKI